MNVTIIVKSHCLYKYKCTFEIIKKISCRYNLKTIICIEQLCYFDSEAHVKIYF